MKDWLKYFVESRDALGNDSLLKDYNISSEQQEY